MWLQTQLEQARFLVLVAVYRLAGPPPPQPRVNDAGAGSPASLPIGFVESKKGPLPKGCNPLDVFAWIRERWETPLEPHALDGKQSGAKIRARISELVKKNYLNVHSSNAGYVITGDGLDALHTMKKQVQQRISTLEQNAVRLSRFLRELE